MSQELWFHCQHRLWDFCLQSISTSSGADPTCKGCLFPKNKVAGARSWPCTFLLAFPFSNQPGALIIQIYSVIKLYMFRASSLPIIRSSLLHIPSWLCLEAVIRTCMKLTSAECTVENSWWWANKMPEKCRVLWQNKFGFLVSGWLLKGNLFQCMVTWM